MPRWLGVLIGILLLAGGTVLVGLNGYATWLQGSTWAVTDGGKFIAKVTAVTMEVVGVVLIGFCAGTAWSAGKRGLSVGLTLIMVVSGGIVINQIASLRATERLSASRTREAAIDRVAAADKLQKDSATSAIKMAADADDRAARRDFIAANKEAIKAFRDAPVEVRVEPDAGAEVWATAFGLTVVRVQMWQSAMEAVWQVVLSMVCFHLAGIFMNPLAWLKGSADRKLPSTPEGSSGRVKSSEESKPSTVADRGENVVDLPARVSAPAQLQVLPASIPETTPKVSSEPARVLQAAPKVPLTLKPAYASVEDYLARHPSVTSQKVIADAMDVSEAKVSRDIRRLKGRGKVKADRKGRSNAITLTPRRNGGLHAVSF